MSENKHEPEPWVIDKDNRPGMAWNNHIVSAADPNQAICFMTHDNTPDNEKGEANARRIVACVNACAGIPNDMVAHVVAFGRQGHDKTVLELDDAKNQLRLKDEKIDHITDALIESDAYVGKCEELQKQRDLLLTTLHITRGNVASLGPAGAIEPYTPYREWLAMIDSAIASVKGGAA